MFYKVLWFGDYLVYCKYPEDHDIHYICHRCWNEQYEADWSCLLGAHGHMPCLSNHNCQQNQIIQDFEMSMSYLQFLELNT